MHRQLLRPCIALTKSVRGAGAGGADASADTAGKSGQQCSIDVGCLTFDRVLLFLEAEVRAYPLHTSHAPSVAGAFPATPNLFFRRRTRRRRLPSLLSRPPAGGWPSAAGVRYPSHG